MRHINDRCLTALNRFRDTQTENSQVRSYKYHLTVAFQEIITSATFTTILGDAVKLHSCHMVLEERKGSSFTALNHISE